MEELKNEQKRKEAKMSIKILNSLFSAMEKTHDRHNLIRDPATRHLLFLERFLLFADVGLGFMENSDTMDEIPAEKKEKWDKVMANFYKDVTDLQDFVQTPHLAPDSNFGKAMMQKAAEDFKEKEKEMEK